jgi:translation initiation factor 2 gamma subunit (eIF-2gamma)
LAEDDAECSEQALRIQAAHRQWVVMWSVWRRTYTAFSCFTVGPLVVDEATPDGLVSAMARVELHHSPTRVDALGGVVVS